jgi:phenylalanyl-tRNA synthetase alpha chain
MDESIEEEWSNACQEISSEKNLEDLRQKWLGAKGIVKSSFQKISSLGPEEKVAAAKRLNLLKANIEEWITSKKEGFTRKNQEQKILDQWVDLSLPAKGGGVGMAHPIHLVERKITSLLQPFGFRVVDGPEVESEYYCFDALNIPQHHPARDMQDTFYIDPVGVLRTHTTSVQARELEKKTLPVKIISCGRVYRNEAEDSSHQSMFHQYELVWVEQGITLANLLALITHVLHGLYGKERKVRFVPKYYPYTDPSIGAQINCLLCQAAGCSFCKGSGWVTIVGAGMIHENVLREFHYDPNTVSGLAFGFGTSRLATQFYGLPNMKSLYVNDLRLLRGLV